MAHHIGYYIEASGSAPETRAEFVRLVTALPKLPEDLTRAAIQVKEALFNSGFSYGHHNFTAQDVLASRSGNCLGLPLLIGSILGDHGFTPKYKVIVTPNDVTHELESEFFRRLKEEMPYDRPTLADKKEEFPMYRFAPLEHLVIDTNGEFLLEATSQEHSFPGCESMRPVSFEEALSFVYKDRAIKSMVANQPAEAKELAKKGLLFWRDNRQLHGLLAAVALETFDDKTYDTSVQRFQELGTDDSLSHFSLYLLTKKTEHLEEALRKYPAYAQALANKAKTLVGTDSQEARYLFALASHCYSNSGVVDLEDFYIAHSSELAMLFEKKNIKRILESFGNDRWGDFDYHLALFLLFNDRRHMTEAREAIETPYQRLMFLAVSKGTEHYDDAELRRMDSQFQDSRLYRESRQDLNI